MNCKKYKVKSILFITAGRSLFHLSALIFTLSHTPAYDIGCCCFYTSKFFIWLCVCVFVFVSFYRRILCICSILMWSQHIHTRIQSKTTDRRRELFCILQTFAETIFGKVADPLEKHRREEEEDRPLSFSFFVLYSLRFLSVLCVCS